MFHPQASRMGLFRDLLPGENQASRGLPIPRTPNRSVRPPGVGCLVDSDGACAQCRDGLEQFCPNQVLTYASPDRHLGGVTYGGYS